MEVKTEDIFRRLIDNDAKIRVLEQRVMNIEQAVVEIKGMYKDTRDIIDKTSHDFSSKFGALGWKVAGGVTGITILVQGIFKVVGG